MSDWPATPLAEMAFEMDIAEGPERILGLVARPLRAAAAHEHAHARASVRGIGIGIPGPVAFATGRPVNPPIMPGWDGFPIPDWFAERYRARRCSWTTT